MPSARDIDWAHIHVVGDRGVAAQHVPFARKLLGFVKQEAARNGLGVNKAVRQLADGTTVTAEIHGAIPRITIATTGKPAKKPVEQKERFVVRPRTAAGETVDDEFPEVVLIPEGEDWRSLFYRRGPAFAAVDAPKGTYRTLQGREVFPDGVRRAGNCDFRSKEGMRVSWHGPSSRYWFDGWRLPSKQYGRKVFMLGQVLLDIDAWCDEFDVDFPQRLVMGAAIDVADRALYVMQANIPDPPVGTKGPFGIDHFECTPPAPVGDTSLRLVRYDLTTRDNAGAAWLTPGGTAQTLWEGELHNANSPWYFSPDCNHAWSPATPDDVACRIENSLGETLDDLELIGGDDAGQLYRIDRAGDSVSITSIDGTLQPGNNQRALIAVDFSDEGVPHGIWLVRNNDVYSLSITDGLNWPLVFRRMDAANPQQTNTYVFWLAWADARHAALVMHRYATYAHESGSSASTPSTLGRQYATYAVIGEHVEVRGLSGRVQYDAEGDPQIGYWAPSPTYHFLKAAGKRPVAASLLLYAAVDDPAHLLTPGPGFRGLLSAANWQTTIPPGESFGGTNDLIDLNFWTRGLNTAAPADDDGMKTLIGAASYDTDGVFSIPTIQWQDTSSESGVQLVYDDFLTNSTLQARTTIGGNEATFTPTWLLGTLPADFLAT